MFKGSFKYVIILLLTLIGCQSDISEESKEALPTKHEQVLARYRGTYSDGKLSFTSVNQSQLHTQGFVDVTPWTSSDPVKLRTDQAFVYNSSCPQYENHSVGYYATSAPPLMLDGNGCDNHHLCALVSLENVGSRDIKNVYVQVTGIAPSGFAGDNSSAVPTGYPLDNSLGLWSHGDLPATSSWGVPARWNFVLPSCANFNFDLAVMGTLTHTSYTVSSTGISGNSFVDACALSGTQVLTNAAAGSVSSSIALPFPFTLYDYTFDTDTNATLKISANGALGFSGATTNNSSLPASGMNYTIFPFWDTLSTTASGVCYVTTGTIPDRKFYVTWKNANIDGTGTAENMTFTVVLTETSDLIEFLYQRWSHSQANCTASSATNSENRGVSATIGVQGNGVATTYSFNSGTALPTHSSACPGNGFKVTLTPSPPSSL